MDKRRFLGTAAFTGLSGLAGLLPAAAPAAARAPAAPGLLTVSGDVGRANRGALDPALDQMFAKHGVRFDRAYVFDAAALHRLPVVRIRPTLEYDGKPHALAGPLLTTVLKAAGVAPDGSAALALRAVDGYTASIGMAEARGLGMIVATEIDGRPLNLGGLGPQWAVLDADRIPALAAKPLNERFAQCPWGLYSVEVRLG